MCSCWPTSVSKNVSFFFHSLQFVLVFESNQWHEGTFLWLQAAGPTHPLLGDNSKGLSGAYEVWHNVQTILVMLH